MSPTKEMLSRLKSRYGKGNIFTHKEAALFLGCTPGLAFMILTSPEANNIYHFGEGYFGFG